MLAYTGAIVERMFGRAIFNLKGIQFKEKVPILLNHNESAIVGFADKVEVTAKGLEMSGFISESTEEGLKVAALADEGFPWEASIGLLVSQWVTLSQDEKRKVNGQEVEGPIHIGETSRLTESSFVTAGADAATEAVALADKTKESEGTMAASEKEILQAEASKATRTELGTFLEAFPEDRQSWAAKQFAVGQSLVETKAALADVVLKELADSKLAVEKADEVVAKLAADQKASADAAGTKTAAEQAVIDELAAKAGKPGVGFNGADRQEGKKTQLASMPIADRAELVWEKSAKVRSEFGQAKGAFLTIVKREGVEQFEKEMQEEAAATA